MTEGAGARGRFDDQVLDRSLHSWMNERRQKIGAGLVAAGVSAMIGIFAGRALGRGSEHR